MTSSCEISITGCTFQKLSFCQHLVLSVMKISSKWRQFRWVHCTGIVSGPCTAGVVGYRIPVFDIAGTTVMAATKISQSGMVGLVSFDVDISSDRPNETGEEPKTHKFHNFGVPVFTKIMFVLTVVKDQLSGETTQFSGHCRQVSLYVGTATWAKWYISHSDKRKPVPSEMLHHNYYSNG